jgi:adenylate cyclase
MLYIEVFDPRSGKREVREHPQGPLEFGRVASGTAVPRIVLDCEYISRNHMRLEELPDGMILVENLSATNPIRLSEQNVIPPKESRKFSLPTTLRLAMFTITIDGQGPDNVPASSLRTLAAAPGRRLARPQETLISLGDSPPPEKLAEWFELIIQVQRAAAGSPEFYQQTAQAVVDLIGLDRGLVLLRSGDGWECVAAYSSRPQLSLTSFSHTIVQQAVQQKRTVYQSQLETTQVRSLMGVEAVVASPIFDNEEKVLGIVYGTRNLAPDSQARGIGSLEALIVQLLASAVAAGLARQKQERQVHALQSQFEQFFSPRLAQELLRNPRLLEGQEREVTVLFSDLRGFSRLSERLGPRDTCRLVRDAMDCFTARVREHDGVVVDFAGDGMLAMWNAPFDQPDHAARACRAALAMLRDLPNISRAYQDLLQGPLGLGIGINTGPALVGNTGSNTRLKYGPFGHTVNLASRVESATKQLGVNLLITGSTRAQLGDSFVVRRLARVRVVGIDAPVELYELHGTDPDPEWLRCRDVYELALRQYESGQWAEVCRTLYPLLKDHNKYDLPSLDLISRAVDCLRHPPASFDPVWELKSK